MIVMKPETRCKRLARDIRPLAAHIAKGFSPCVQRISIRREDWDLLRETAEAARAEGFAINGDRISYQGIEVAPTDVTHTAS